MQLPANFSTLFFLLWAVWNPCMLPAQWAEQGEASYYADKFHGRPTASGEKYNKHHLTAAHRTLPMGSVVRVVRLDNDLSVDVRINDCGPHKPGRIIDLSKAAAKKIGLLHDGITRVRIELITPGNGHCACDRNKKWDASEWTASGKVPVESTGNGGTEHEAGTPIPGPPPGNAAPEPASPSKEIPNAGTAQGLALQIGAFGNRANADKLIQSVKNQNFNNVFSKEFARDEGMLYRVYLGIFDSREEAVKAQNDLKQKMDIDGLVVELKP